jgi:sulfate adenylyltransferase subunit 2
MQEEYNLSHLKELEAESIHIIREVAAEFENPVMLYSIGKDSSVMVRLAEKAFAPGKVPFPLMHIDSKWKYTDAFTFADTGIVDVPKFRTLVFRIPLVEFVAEREDTFFGT